MNRPQQSVTEIWENAEALIEHFEQVTRAWGKRDSTPASAYFDELVTRLRTTTNAQSVSLLAVDHATIETLARTGITISSERRLHAETRLSASLEILPETTLHLELQFADPVLPVIRQPVSELCVALLDLSSGIVLRDRLCQLLRQQQARDDQDLWIEGLYRGSTLRECFASIATSIATHCQIDRVSLLRTDQHRCELIACSNRPSIDRRASQVRWLENLVAARATDEELEPELAIYRERSNCQQIEIQSIPSVDTYIVLERFAGPLPGEPSEPNVPEETSVSGTPNMPGESLRDRFDSIRPHIEAAVVAAVERESFDWTRIRRQLTSQIQRSRAIYLVPSLMVGLAIATLVQVPFHLPVDGQVVAANSRRIFAPAEGIVDEVLVGDGDIVRAGTPLVRLRSPKLDLQQRAIEGTLATARTQLDSLRVSRDDREQSQSADEKVLKTEIAGLETQLQLIEKQQHDLAIISPIGGRVDRWDLRSTLTARPVAVGQYLMNVVAESDGWQVELSIPDQNAGYVMSQQQLQPCDVSFRLRSEATTVHQGVIESIAESTRIDPQGQSVVLATVPVQTSDLKVRDGATVLAQVDCGSYPIGFVWFRGLIEWWRGSTWF